MVSESRAERTFRTSRFRRDLVPVINTTVFRASRTCLSFRACVLSEVICV